MFSGFVQCFFDFDVLELFFNRDFVFRFFFFGMIFCFRDLCFA